MDKVESRKYLIIGGAVLLVIAVYYILNTYRPPEATPAPAPNVSQELPKGTPGIAQASTPGKCYANQCRNWISGSCSKKKLYKERECFRYGAFPDCPEEVYYESHEETVEACEQTECPAGKNFFNYTCV